MQPREQSSPQQGHQYWSDLGYAIEQLEEKGKSRPAGSKGELEYKMELEESSDEEGHRGETKQSALAAPKARPVIKGKGRSSKTKFKEAMLEDYKEWGDAIFTLFRAWLTETFEASLKELKTLAEPPFADLPEFVRSERAALSKAIGLPGREIAGMTLAEFQARDEPGKTLKTLKERRELLKRSAIKYKKVYKQVETLNAQLGVAAAKNTVKKKPSRKR